MRQQSFVRGLFFGIIEDGLIFPWPEPVSDEVRAIHPLLGALRRFFETDVDSEDIDRQERIPDETMVGLRRLGTFGLLIPKRFGGLGLSRTGYARVIQEIAGLDASVAMTVGAHQSIGANGLLLFGTEAQKTRFLPDLATGERIAAFALTEAASGSDAGAVQTRAELQDDGSYRLSGTKTWVTNGGMADLFTVFARTSSAEEGVKPRLTAFVVERGPGVSSGPNEPKLGIRGTSTTEVVFDGVSVAADQVLGEPDRGFKVAMKILSSGRLGLAGGCVGMSKRAIKLAVERCSERRAFGRSIGEFGLLKDKIATMVADTWALESMTYLTTGIVDAGAQDFSVESAICKVFASETCWRVVNDALQIAAGAGYMAGSPYERLLRDARVNLVFHGTNETLRAFIALAGMQGPGREHADVSRVLRAPARGLGVIGEIAMRKARGVLGRQRMVRHHPALNREAAIFETYVHELTRGVAKVLQRHGPDIAEMQYTQKRAAGVVIDLYAIAACIARATRAIERRGEEGARREIDLTRVFARAAERRLAATVAAIHENDDELRKAVASRMYVDRAYPFDVF